MFQPDVEMLPRADLTRLQEERWRRLFERLERSPFYQGRLTLSHSIKDHPLDAVADLPFTRKKDLRDHYP